MRIERIGCESYKAFRDPVELQLRPLTILCGKNSSGKSVLLRLPRLLLRAMSVRSGRSFPLKVDELSFGERALDLVHNRQAHGSVDFFIRLGSAKGSMELRATLQTVFEPLRPSASRGGGDSAFVSRLHLEGERQLDVVWDGRSSSPPRYGDRGELAFRGLLPELDIDRDPTLSPWVESWRAAVRDHEERTQHLGPSRAAVDAVYEHSTRSDLGIDGSAAPFWIIADSKLEREVGRWYADHLDGWRLSAAPSGDAFALELVRGDVRVNLAAAGQGMQEVLPVVVQQKALAMASPGAGLSLVEQPELHLHDAAHGALADLFVETARTRPDLQQVVETHSESFLLRLRRRIAENRLTPDHVALYWVDDREEGYSSVRLVEIDEYGEIDGWPEGVFSEAYDEVRAIRRAARKRRDAEQR